MHKLGPNTLVPPAEDPLSRETIIGRLTSVPYGTVACLGGAAILAGGGYYRCCVLGQPPSSASAETMTIGEFPGEEWSWRDAALAVDFCLGKRQGFRCHEPPGASLHDVWKSDATGFESLDDGSVGRVILRASTEDNLPVLGGMIALEGEPEARRAGAKLLISLMNGLTPKSGGEPFYERALICASRDKPIDIASLSGGRQRRLEYEIARAASVLPPDGAQGQELGRWYRTSLLWVTVTEQELQLLKQMPEETFKRICVIAEVASLDSILCGRIA